MQILNFGSLNIDHVYNVDHFVAPGETLCSADYKINAGGKGLNQSIALARAGVATLYAGMIGKDGIFLRDLLESSGVNVDHGIDRRLSNGTRHHSGGKDVRREFHSALFRRKYKNPAEILF